MPRVRRRRLLAADADAIWAVVSDPRRLPAWWPGVERVEEADPEAWTNVMRSSRGKLLRADFTRLAADAPHTLEWRQELEESPFERFLTEARTRVSIDPVGPGEARVELDSTRRLRGLARLGWPLVRRATRKQLDEALSGLADAAGDRAVAGRRGRP